MTRNQKMDLHPKNCARIPPRTGPIAGPSSEPASVKPIYAPRSEAVATSETTPLAMAIVPLLPELCKHRRMKRAA